MITTIRFRYSDLPAWSVAAAALFAPIKPAPLNVFLSLAMLSVLAFANNRQYLLSLFRSGFALWPLGFFAVLCLLQAFSGSSWEAANEYIGKYARFAYIPFVAAAIPLDKDRLRVLQGFSLGMLITLILSYGIAFVPNLCEHLGMEGCGPSDNPFVFKQHITHGFFMTLAVGLWGFWAWTRKQVGYAALAVFGLINLIAMMEGRTAWVLVLVFAAALVYRRLGAARAAVLLAVGVAVAVPITLNRIEHSPMLTQAIQEYRQWADTGVAPGRSGMRLTYYSHALKAIEQAPVAGHGLGGTRQALDLERLEPKIYALNNPHNQYLLFGVQGGMLILASYLALQLAMYRRRNAWPGHALLGAGFLLAYAVGNLFNSFHFDMAEAVLYCVGCAVLFAVPQAGRDTTNAVISDC